MDREENNMKRIIFVILILVCLAVTLPAAAASAETVSDTDISVPAVVESGTCGKTVNWELYSNGLLRIYGTGDMKDYKTYTDLEGSSVPSPFRRREDIKEVVIESGVTSIGKEVFYECSAMEKITIPDSVTSIGEQALKGCGLTSVVIPKTVTEFGDYIFLDCLELESAVLAEGMAAVPKGMFCNCPALKSISIPSTCRSIEHDAFEECKSLTSVTIPDGCTSIGWTAFSMCDSLSEVVIPNTVTKIDSYAFSYSNALETITIPGSITTIGQGAFQSCENLREVKFSGTGITAIGMYVFADCVNLETVVLPDTVQTIDYRAFYNTSIKHFAVPASATRINSGAFDNCTKLESFSAPEGNAYYFAVEGVLYDTLGRTAASGEDVAGTLHTYPKGKKDKSCSIYKNLYRMLNPICNEYVEKLTFGEVRTAGSSDKNPTLELGGCPNLTEIKFMSSQVNLSETSFSGLTATVYHSGWAESRQQSRGGNITWVDVANRIEIIKQPVSDSAGSGKYVSATVEAEGEGLTYQWYYTDPGCITTRKSSVTADTYTFKMTSEKAGRRAYCVVTDAFGAVIKTDTVYFGMININSQPASVCAKIGSTATFSVSASGTGLTYQWYEKNPGDKDFEKSSVTGTTYSCTISEDMSGRQIYCEITDSWGGKVNSNTADIIIFGITKQPENASAALGNTVSTSVRAEGEGLKYQWYVKNRGQSSFIPSSIKTDTYAYQMTSAKSGRQVYCIVTDKYGNTEKTQTATLSRLEITVQPVNASAQAGKNVSAKVTAAGEGLAYQWYIRDKGQASYSPSKIIEPVYIFTITEAKSGRQAYCIVYDKYGNSIKSDTVTFTMGGGELKITKQPESAVAAVGKTVSATVEAEGEGLTYQWYIKDSGKSVFSKSSITKNTYSYQMTEAKSGRQAYCIVSDSFGNSEITDVVTFYMPVAITKQPVSASAKNGEVVSVSVTASGHGLTYQWYVANAGSSKFSKSSITSGTYKIEMNSARDGRRIYCIITDAAGNTAKSDTVTLSLPQELTITKLPSNASAAEGKTVKTAVEAVGEGLTYQWYICDAGKSKFSKSSVTGTTYSYVMTEAKSGRRAYCIITDKYGSSVKTNTVTFTMK